MLRSVPLLTLLPFSCLDTTPEIVGTLDEGELVTELAVAHAPPPRTLSLEVNNLFAGDMAELHVSGAEPGDMIRIGYGRSLGAGPCPAALNGLCLDITAPVHMASFGAFADADGEAWLWVRVPNQRTGPIAIHFAHRVGALCVAVTVIGLCTQVLRRCRADAWLARPAALLLTMLLVQVSLGATAIWTKLSVLPTTAHVMIGGATVAVSALLTLRLWRRFRLPAAERVPAGTPATAPRPSDARGVTA